MDNWSICKHQLIIEKMKKEEEKLNHINHI
jgi:hypothetical protein